MTNKDSQSHNPTKKKKKVHFKDDISFSDVCSVISQLGQKGKKIS